MRAHRLLVQQFTTATECASIGIPQQSQYICCLVAGVGIEPYVNTGYEPARSTNRLPAYLIGDQC